MTELILWLIKIPLFRPGKKVPVRLALLFWQILENIFTSALKNGDWRGLRKIICIKSLRKFHRRIYDSVWKPLTVLKMTGCFLVISEAAILMCFRNNFYRKFIGKTLPLALAWLIHDIMMCVRSSCHSAVFLNIFWIFSWSILMELFQ